MFDLFHASHKAAYLSSPPLTVLGLSCSSYHAFNATHVCLLFHTKSKYTLKCVRNIPRLCVTAWLTMSLADDHWMLRIKWTILYKKEVSEIYFQLKAFKKCAEVH